MTRCCVLLRVLIVMFLSSDALADDVAVSLDHLKPETRTDVSVEPGDNIVVTLANTCPGNFDLSYVGYRNAEGSPPAFVGGGEGDATKCDATGAAAELKANGYCKLESAPEISFVHSKSYTAYEIKATRKRTEEETKGLKADDWTTAIKALEGNKSCSAAYTEQEKMLPKSNELDSASFFVSIRQSPWAVGMSGGLAVSWVTDPRFAVVADPSNASAKVVVRDRDAEDSEHLAFAGFVHVYNQNWKILKKKGGGIPIAATFGLGLQEQSSISGFLGVTAAAWELAYLTIGMNWRSVDRLPAGQAVDKAPISDDVLKNPLPTRTDHGLFIALTFKFMSPGDSFFKEKTASPPPKQQAPAQ